MLLTPQDAQLFFKLHRTLMFFVNKRLKVLRDNVATPEEFSGLAPEIRGKVRDALIKHMDLIEAFVRENPAHLPEDELDIIRSWRHLVAGKFFIFRELKNYTVFLTTGKQPIAYGVVALTQPFEELIGPYLPVFVETVLLPFKDKIIYDGLINSFNMTFGSGIRRSLNASFKEAKERFCIVTSLPLSHDPDARPLKQAKAKARRKPKNIFMGLPAETTDESTKSLLRAPGIRIERIVSHGQASKKGFWYDQDRPEWVLLIAGAARLSFESEEPFEMKAGSFVNIPAHRRHRVEWTDPNQPTIWLAIHYTQDID